MIIWPFSLRDPRRRIILLVLVPPPDVAVDCCDWPVSNIDCVDWELWWWTMAFWRVVDDVGGGGVSSLGLLSILMQVDFDEIDTSLEFFVWVRVETVLPFSSQFDCICRFKQYTACEDIIY